MLLALTWCDIVGGVVAGLIATALVGTFFWVHRWWRDRHDFGSLAGDYDATRKGTGEEDGNVTITGERPNLDLNWVMPDGSVATGTIVMNEQSRVTGSGSYTHRRGPDVGWGYLNMQVAANDRSVLLVDGRYTDATRQEVVTGWVWRRREDGS